ncbi:16839_t:CDS:1, partial [Racocetra persica]
LLQDLINNSFQSMINTTSFDLFTQSITNIHQLIKKLQYMQIHNLSNSLSLLLTLS